MIRIHWDAGGYACLSDLALQFTAGILAHTPAIMAFTNPTTNSYKRFAPGLAAPANLSFSVSNRSSAVRIPGYSINEKDQRLEYRIPDAASWGLDVAMPIAFIGMTIPFVRNVPMGVCVLTAGTSGLLTMGLPYKLGIIVSALAGVLAGLLTEVAMRKQKEAAQP